MKKIVFVNEKCYVNHVLCVAFGLVNLINVVKLVCKNYELEKENEKLKKKNKVLKGTINMWYRHFEHVDNESLSEKQKEENEEETEE